MRKYVTRHDLYQALCEQSLRNEKTFEQMRDDVAQIVADEVKSAVSAALCKKAPFPAALTKQPTGKVSVVSGVPRLSVRAVAVTESRC